MGQFISKKTVLIFGYLNTSCPAFPVPKFVFSINIFGKKCIRHNISTIIIIMVNIKIDKKMFYL